MSYNVYILRKNYLSIIKKKNNSFLKQSPSLDPWCCRDWSVVLFPCLACLYLYIFARLVARHGYSPEPVHVYELNAYLDLMVWASCSGFGLGHLQHSLAPASPWSPYCVVTNYLQYCARLCLYADISAGEVDR